MKERVTTTNRYRNQTVTQGNNALQYQEKIEDSRYLNPKREKVNPLKQQLKAEKAKINILCTIVNAFVIIATLGICVVFLKTQFNSYQLNQEIEYKKQELSSLKKENMQMHDDMKNSIDLDYIYNEAINRLGMHVPGKGDVYIIRIEPLTYTTKYTAVEIKEEATTLGNVLGYITRGW